MTSPRGRGNSSRIQTAWHLLFGILCLFWLFVVIMEARVNRFLLNATTVVLKAKLEQMGIDCTGNKNTLKVWLEDAVKNLTEAEMREYFPENTSCSIVVDEDENSADINDLTGREEVRQDGPVVASSRVPIMGSDDGRRNNDRGQTAVNAGDENVVLRRGKNRNHHWEAQDNNDLVHDGIDEELQSCKVLPEKRQELMRLKKMIRQLSAEVDGEPQQKKSFNFRDIEQSLQTFSGEDKLGVRS